MWIRVLIVLIGIGWTSLVGAQNDIGKFSNYNISDGLSQSTVTSIFLDKKGFIWMGTSDGLNRFDGKKFTIFKNKYSNRNSLSDSWILRILAEDSENNLWILTSDRALNKFNLKSNQITRFIPNANDSATLPPFQRIYSLVEDSLKNIWFSTNTGIYKFCYPKYTIKKYGEDLQIDYSKKDQIVWITRDNCGEMWFGSSQGVCKYDYSSDKIIKYSTESLGYKGLPSGKAIASRMDIKKQFWILTQKGLCLYNRSAGNFTFFPFPSNFIDKQEFKVSAFLADKSGNIWIGSMDGLIKFNESLKIYTLYKNEPQKAQSLSNNLVTRIFESSEGEIWIGTASGLNKYDVQKNSFERYYQKTGEKVENNISEIYQLNNGEIWIFRFTDADNMGLICRVNRKGKYLENFLSNTCDPNGMVTSLVYPPITDKIGNLWMGTFGDGAIKYSPRRSNFVHYRNVSGGPAGFSSVWGFGEDYSGNIWVALYDQGFAKFDTLNHTFISYKPAVLIEGKPVNYCVMSVCPDKKGKIWIATVGAGLLCFDPKSNKLVDFNANKIQKGGYSDYNIRIMTQSPSGKLFLGHANQGVDIFDPQTGEFEKLIHDPLNKNSLPNNSIWYVLPDKQQNLWISMNGFISYYNITTKKFIHYTTGVNSQNGFPADKALSILESSNGTVWFGTSGGGLCHLDPKTKKFITYSEEDGLINNVVYGITEDIIGNLWLSTNKGLSRFDPRSKTFRNFDESSGLQSSEFNEGAFFKSRENIMYFGGINGFNEFNPLLITADTITPTTVLTGFQINNKEVPVIEPSKWMALNSKNKTRLFSDRYGYSLPMDITYLNSLTIPYTVKVFNIEFAALLSNSPEKCTFRYKMEGFDEDWNYSGTRNYATYTNLPHGTYHFLVQSANPDGVWGKEPACIQIIIIPPFWKTWWFLTILGLIIITIIWLYIIIRERNLRRSKLLLEERVKQRTQQIEEKNEELRLRNIEISKQKEEIDFQAKQLKSELVHHNQSSEIALLRSQINPHFLFNTLNNIYSLIYKKSDDAPTAVMKLSEIMRYMLYDANTDLVPLEKEINYLKSFIELQVLRLRNRECVDFSITGSIYGKMIAPMLFIPFIENAFKHGNKKSENPCIIIKLELNGQHIFFDIENQYQRNDMINKDKTGGIGLANVRRRLELLYPNTHNLVIEDLEGKFHVTLDLNLHEN